MASDASNAWERWTQIGVAGGESKMLYEDAAAYIAELEAELKASRLSAKDHEDFADDVKGDYAELEAERDRLREALEKSVGLQSHYAKLLNMHDGGERIAFKDAQDWLDRLASLKGGGDD